MLATLAAPILELVDKAGGQWGIVLEDLTTNERWTLNENQRFYAASLIKVPIMTAVFAEAYAGKFAFEDKLKLRREDLVGGAGVLQHMSPGTEIAIADLVTLMIIQSDNTATNILIDLLGKDVIRSVMARTEMNNSQFYNKLMIVPAELEGYNEVTAADMANHFRYLSTGKIISHHSCLQMINLLKKQQIRDCLPLFLPDPEGEIIGTLPRWELANKTGTVSNIQHDTGILYVGDKAITICALSKDVEAKRARETIGHIGRIVYERFLTQPT
jgi:beta-lactamase class A